MVEFTELFKEIIVCRKKFLVCVTTVLKKKKKHDKIFLPDGLFASKKLHMHVA